jgi:FlaA1/EpsC-like NDP-sugar epimerase
MPDQRNSSPRNGYSRWEIDLPDRILLPLDIGLGLLAILLASSFRFESFIPPDPYPAVLGSYALVSLPLRMACFAFGGLYRRMWRFAGLMDLERVLVATLVAALLDFGVGAWALPALGVVPVRVPFSILALDGLLTIGLVAGPRFLVRMLTRRAFLAISSQQPRRALIAGAGQAGGLVARELLANPGLGILPVGFLDDADSKQGLRLQGLPVVGRLADLSRVVREHGADEVIIAMPSAEGRVLRTVLDSALAARVAARTVPSVSEILTGRMRVTSLRPVEIADLLRREPVQIDLNQIGQMVRGRTVLVTGAGGSIGSELCRQVAALGPARLLLMGHGENSIFGIQRELIEVHPDVRTVPLIADIRDRARCDDLISRWQPHTILHAAAHKHVPLMEENVPDAITNNILGTRNLAECAVTVEATLLLISTDKAVRPTSVMGATKRVAEQIVQELAELHERHFVAVRFGNVLGSRGSVVPAFLEQIRKGGPITITHPEMRRFFMTIPEASQLVLQAAALGRGGEIFVLDMGEPVRIMDLAHDLVRLSGLEVGRDIEIVLTGMRPGEKLYEELFFGPEVTMPTGHPKVLRAKQPALPLGLSGAVSELVDAAQRGAADDNLRELLSRLVPDYQPGVIDVELSRAASLAPRSR